MSPLLFALAIEPLAKALGSNNRIQGISRGGFTHTASLYADDLLQYITNLITSIPEILRILQEFGNISGYKRKFNKSEYFPMICSAREYPNLPFKLSTESVTHLGVKVTKSN